MSCNCTKRDKYLGIYAHLVKKQSDPEKEMEKKLTEQEQEKKTKKKKTAEK